MKKIAIDGRIWNKIHGGVSRYSRNLVTELSKIDQTHDYTVILRPEDEKDFNITAPNFHPLTIDAPHYSYREQLVLNHVLNQGQFDLVHFTHFAHPLLYRRPFVVTVHDLIMHLYPSGIQTRSPIRKLAYRAVMQDCVRAKNIIVPSQATKSDLVKMLNFPTNKITVTHEAAEESFSQVSTQEIATIKKKFSLPDRYILFVSRWEKYKGLENLIAAFEKLSSTMPKLGLVICGKPAPQSPEIGKFVYSKQAQGLKIITPGFVTDQELAGLYKSASVYVHPSWYEGFGIMILEAFSAGVPVVTSNISSLPEVAADAALLVNPRDVDKVTEAITQILSDPKLAQALRNKGLKRVKQFSWKKMAEETLAVYQKALKTDG